MIEQICAFLHNYFTTDRCGRYWHRERGEFTIEGGSITLPFLVDGQYFRIVGSRLNDGVYQYPVAAEPGEPHILKDETFEGEIYEMRVPRGLLALTDEIDGWVAEYGKAMNSPYQSESVIGVYSYAKGGGTNGDRETGGDWQTVFGKRLNEWRKIS